MSLKKIFLFVFFIISNPYAETNIILTPSKIFLTDSLEMKQIDLLNLDNIPNLIIVNYDTTTLKTVPDSFYLAPKELRHLQITLKKPNKAKFQLKKTIVIRNNIIRDSIQVFIKPLMADSINKNDLNETLDSLKSIIMQKDKIIHSLKSEIRSKDLELITLTQEANRDLEELKQLKLPEFVLEDPVNTDEYLNTLYQRLKDNLTGEIRDKEVMLSWRDNNICLTLAGKISFTTGSTYMKLRGETILKKVCDLLKQYPNQQLKIMVMGHTDAQPYKKTSGNGFSNWELSALRATKVVRCLMRLGVFDGKNLYSVGNSAYHPIADNNTYQGRVENRRIELLISLVD